MPDRSVRLAASLALLALAPLPLHAQMLHVRAVEETTGQPLAGAIADVLDADGRVAVQSILSSDGRRTFALPGPGRWQLRLRRIGFEPHLAPPVEVAGRDTATLELRVPARRVTLGAVVVTGRRRCAGDAFADEGFATLWEEARKALTTTVLSREGAALVLEARAFRRRLRDDRATVEQELVGLPRTTDAARPYVARPAAELAREGYVRGGDDGTAYFAPDERVLLSDEFVATHCFEVTRGEGTAAGLLGVRFHPAERRRVNDVAGTLWLDPATAELRYLDFWHVHETMPRAAQGEGRSGGQVVFDRLRDGRWIVSAWRLRMPDFGSRRALNRLSWVDAWEETGGVVTPPSGHDGPPSPVLAPYQELLAPARIVGTVYDSLGGRPLAGARVWMVPIETAADAAAGLVTAGGTLAVAPVADTADAAGRFALERLPAGSWRLGFDHPTLDSLGVLPTRYDLRLRPGATVAADLAVPSLVTLAAGCAVPADAPRRGDNSPVIGPERGIVFGTVRSAADGRPLQDALVRVAWTDVSAVSAERLGAAEASVEARTDSLGLYRVCGVPPEVVVTAQAAGPTARTGVAETQLGPLGVARVNLELAEGDAGQAAAPGAVHGTVADSAGRPVADALVLLDGATVQARTDSAGAFRLAGVPAGTQSLEVRQVGLAPARRSVSVPPGDTARVSLVLARSQLLDAVVVTAASGRLAPKVADAVRRHKAGFGQLYLEEEIARAATLPTLFQHVPGVRLAQARLGVGGDWVVLMRNHVGSQCPARIFVDERETDGEELMSISKDDVVAVEVFVRPTTAPIFTSGRSRFSSDMCGVIVVWTRGAR